MAPSIRAARHGREPIRRTVAARLRETGEGRDQVPLVGGDDLATAPVDLRDLGGRVEEGAAVPREPFRF